MGPVQIEKYYVDVVGPDGRGCIGYAARLDGLGLHATAAATLCWDHPPAIRQQRTLRGTVPVWDEHGLAWRCPALDASGVWSGRDAATAEQVLWREPAGTLRWRTLAPHARVQFTVAGETITGLGYAECLHLDFTPWHLPIDALRWGRFISDQHSVVWIEWTHATPRRWLWHNGQPVAAFTLHRDAVVWAAHRLELQPPRTLRCGRLADTVLARWPAVRRLLPRQIQAFDETKWCAPASLLNADGARDDGWVIHEYVRFR